MKKIFIAIKNNFRREIYCNIFRKEGFEVLETQDAAEVLNLVMKEKPDIILLDVNLSGTKGFETLAEIKKEPLIQRIPVFVFSLLERKKDKIRAMDLDAKDFIIGNQVTPLELVLKVKIAMGEQNSYRVSVNDESDIKKLSRDLGYQGVLRCPKCGRSFVLYLIRDLSKGKNYFKVSFVCPKCF